MVSIGIPFIVKKNYFIFIRNILLLSDEFKEYKVTFYIHVNIQ